MGIKKAELFLASLHEAINTNTISGKLMFHLFGALAELERNLMVKRTLGMGPSVPILEGRVLACSFRVVAVPQKREIVPASNSV